MRKMRKRKIIIIASFIMIFLLTVGYASFNTNINLKVKGNINDLTPEKLKQTKDVYKDEYEEERHIYKGTNPNNYIKFNNELWRIIAIEKDNTLKIMREESIGQKEYDTANHRNNSQNTFCSVTPYCNVWSKTDGTFQGYFKSGIVTEDASLNTYLNTKYYETLDSKYITTHVWNVGGTDVYKSSIKEHLENEKAKTWEGKVGLITVTDYLKSSQNEKCTSAKASKDSTFPCNDSYLLKNTTYRIITPGHGTFYEDCESCYGWYVHKYGSLGDNEVDPVGYGDVTIKLDIFPVVYLTSNITLKGKGEKTSPYEITN